MATTSHHSSDRSSLPLGLRLAGLDFLVLAFLLAGINFFVLPGDPGWLTVNPTPALLLPLLLGVRYGFNVGVVSGLLTAALVLLARVLLLSPESLGSEILDHRFVLASLPLAGVLLGQLAESLKNRSLALSAENGELRDQSRLLHAERELLVLAKQDLQQRLGLFGADYASLDEDLQSLVRGSKQSSPKTLLTILARITNLRSAAVYHASGKADANTHFSRLATIGREEHFPSSLLPRDHHVANAALTKNCLMTQRGLLEETPTREPGYLLAIPVPGPQGTLLLVVQDLPYAEVSMRTFTTIRTICRWFEVTVLNPVRIPAGHKALDQEAFFHALENALATHASQAVPSTVVRIPFDAPADTPAFNRFLAELPHSGLVTNTIDHGRRSILFLFPAISDPELISKFITAFGNFTNQAGLTDADPPLFHLTNPDESPQHLWGKLVGAY